MKLPKDTFTLVIVFLVLFLLIKGFKFGELLGNIF